MDMKGAVIFFFWVILHMPTNLAVYLSFKADNVIFIFSESILKKSCRWKVGLFQEEFFTCNLILLS